MHVHLVLVTKYWREVFTKTMLDELHLIFASVCVYIESELVEFDWEEDHVHLLVNYPPKVAISKLVNSLKGVSSHLIRKKLWLGTISSSRKHRLKSIFSSGHANPVLNEKVCVCPLDQSKLLFFCFFFSFVVFD